MWKHRPLWIVSPPQLEQKWTEKISCLDIWINRNHIRVPLGTSALKEGVVVVVEEGTLQGEKKGKKKEGDTDHRCKHSPREKREVIYTIRLFGTKSLKEGAM
jgi:hypothetical protein